VKRSTSKGSEFFVHDNWHIVLTLDKNGSVTNKFLWGAKQDELIAQNSAYALCDHLGTVRDLIGNGIAAHFEYNTFGQLLSKIGNTDCVFKYTGKMTNDVTNLQWNINRWYDANVGRWISEDPIGFYVNRSNLFSYVRNRPLIYYDRLGLVDDQVIQFGIVRSKHFQQNTTFGNIDIQLGYQNTSMGQAFIGGEVVKLIEIDLNAYQLSPPASLVIKKSNGKWQATFRLIGYIACVVIPQNDSDTISFVNNIFPALTVANVETEIERHEMFHYTGIIGLHQSALGGLSTLESFEFCTQQEAIVAFGYGMSTVSELNTAYDSYQIAFDSSYASEINNYTNGIPPNPALWPPQTSYNLTKYNDFWTVFHQSSDRTEWLSKVNPL
jgi:RHS repeat-associated protein